jgi:AraC-like DNA-binding protein
MTATPPLEILRHESADGSWEMVRRAPPAALRDLVDGAYCGWTESGGPAPVRRELPVVKVPLIFNFGAPYRIGPPGGSLDGSGLQESFAAGLYDSFAETQATGPAMALQLDLTPLGAYRLLAISPRELAGASTALADAFGRGGASLVASLAEAPSWEERFRRLDQALLARLAGAPEAPPAVAWAWARLHASGGNAAIGPLAAGLGWSRKHLIERFRTVVGLPPKRLARILRFQRLSEALRQLEAPGARGLPWAGLAFEHGYYDQAHLIRDCREFAGCTPRGLLARRLPGGGWSGDAPAGRRSDGG